MSIHPIYPECFPVFVESSHRDVDTPVPGNEVLQEIHGILPPLVLPDYTCKQASDVPFSGRSQRLSRIRILVLQERDPLNKPVRNLHRVARDRVGLDRQTRAPKDCVRLHPMLEEQVERHALKAWVSEIACTCPFEKRPPTLNLAHAESSLCQVNPQLPAFRKTCQSALLCVRDLEISPFQRRTALSPRHVMCTPIEAKCCEVPQGNRMPHIEICRIGGGKLPEWGGRLYNEGVSS